MEDWLVVEQKQPDTADISCSNTPESFSIADLVAQTASQALQELQSSSTVPDGFYWYEQWGAYYSPDTGYFYDSNSALFYHPNTPHLYYAYNSETGQYDEVVSKNNDGGAKWSKKGYRRRAVRLFGTEFTQTITQDETDVLELTLDLVDRCSFLAGDYIGGAARMMKRALMREREEDLDGVQMKRQLPAKAMASTSSDSEVDEEGAKDEELARELARREAEEEIARNAPCIRLVEYPAGKLHIVTICGARVGFGPNMDIQLESPSADGYSVEGQHLLTIFYKSSQEIADEESGYSIEPCSQVPIEKDGYQLELLTRYPIAHEDKLMIAHHTCLLFHIHNGLNTCQSCEPGLFATQISEETPKTIGKRISRQAEHRRQMRALKGAGNSELNELRHKYVDRAGRRRKVVGSEGLGGPSARNPAGGIYAKCNATPQLGCSADSVQLQMQEQSKSADTNTPIDAANRGFKLLKGMGWTEGQGLGKANQGIQGPIETRVKADRAGLGTSTATSKIRIRLTDKLRILAKTRQRYEKVEMQQQEGSRD